MFRGHCNLVRDADCASATAATSATDVVFKQRAQAADRRVNSSNLGRVAHRPSGLYPASIGSGRRHDLFRQTRRRVDLLQLTLVEMAMAAAAEQRQHR